MKVTGEGEAVCFKEAEVRVMGAMEVLSCFNGGDDDHDQGGLKEVDFHSTESAEKKGVAAECHNQKRIQCCR